MIISKVITATAKSVVGNKTVVQNTQNLITKSSPKVCNTIPDLAGILPKTAKFHEYPPKTQEIISNFRNEIWKFAQEKTILKFLKTMTALFNL